LEFIFEFLPLFFPCAHGILVSLSLSWSPFSRFPLRLFPPCRYLALIREALLDHHNIIIAPTWNIDYLDSLIRPHRAQLQFPPIAVSDCAENEQIGGYYYDTNQSYCIPLLSFFSYTNGILSLYWHIFCSFFLEEFNGCQERTEVVPVAAHEVEAIVVDVELIARIAFLPIHRRVMASRARYTLPALCFIPFRVAAYPNHFDLVVPFVDPAEGLVAPDEHWLGILCLIV